MEEEGDKQKTGMGEVIGANRPFDQMEMRDIHALTLSPPDFCLFLLCFLENGVSEEFATL